MHSPTRVLRQSEFIPLLAMMTSVVALATDIMLPALAGIGAELGITDPNDAQLTIHCLFIGLSVGQLIAGPLSDSIGRRAVVFVGYGIFILGTLLSALTDDFYLMLIGRVMQGLGAAGPRIVATAVVRDCYEGRAMARILSFIMVVFIFVPAIAPAIGQGLIWWGGWRATFWFLLVFSIVTALWYGVRQPETLPPAARRPFSVRAISFGLREALGYRVTLGASIATGLIFAPFLAYLSTAQQIFQQTYATGADFALWFASAALCFGIASFVNGRLVMRLGMRYLTRWALIGLATGSAVFLVPVLIHGGQPPFWMFMAWLAPTFFCLGLGFGNLNALAIEPLGHMAGLGAALVGSLSTAVALPFGWFIGQSYDGGVTPLVAGYAGLGAVAYMLFRWAAATSSKE